MLKDRLYADATRQPGRRAAQFVLARLHDDLTRLLAPIIPHTAEESWDYAANCRQAAQVSTWRHFPSRIRDGTIQHATHAGKPCSKCARQSCVALEGLRKNKTIGSAQEVGGHGHRGSRPIFCLLRRTANCWPHSASSRKSSSWRHADPASPDRFERRGGTLATRQVRAMLELTGRPSARRPAPDLCDRCASVISTRI